MRIGVPKEAKPFERRAALTPKGVSVLTQAGHTVHVARGAGVGCGHADEDYLRAGAIIAENLQELYRAAELIVKVKELQPEEYALLRPDHVLFCYLHLAASRETADAMLSSGCTGFAFETVSDGRGGLPLLAPMSRIAGKLAVLESAHYLTTAQGGYGALPGGVPGAEPGHALILGAGTAGAYAAETAASLGMRVTVLDVNPAKLSALEQRLGSRCAYLFSTPALAAQLAALSEIVVGCVLVAGAAAPKILSKEAVANMKPGAVFADVAIDQGGCSETSRVTTLGDPVYRECDVIHYCPANIPSLAARTASAALESAVLPYVLTLAAAGTRARLTDDPGLMAGLNVAHGKIMCPAVRAALGLPG